MFIENFTKFLGYYGRGKNKSVLKYIILSFIAGGFEFLGVALVYPFILLLLNPQASYFGKLNLHFSPYYWGVIAVLLFLIKDVFMIWQIKVQTKFVQDWTLEIRNFYMGFFLYNSYKNTASIKNNDKIYVINFLIPNVLQNFILRIMNLFVNIIIVFAILGLLFWKFTLAAIVASIFSVITIAFQHIYFKNKMNYLSFKTAEKTKVLQEKLQEIVYNLKQVKISCLEDKFMNDFSSKQEELNNYTLESGFISGIPPYIIEFLIIVTLVLLLGIVSVFNKNNSEVLIASYAVMVAAIFRIAPALNRIQTSINGINLSRQYVKELNDYYEKFALNNLSFDKYDENLKFENLIRLENITFSYKNRPVIKNLSMEIKKGEFIGLVGLSGVGKTTLADIIMGLLPIDNGSIYIDDKKIENVPSLRKFIGYVPQKTVMLGKTFAENISWGADVCDMEKVKEVLCMTGMYDFIMNTYNDGLNAQPLINEDGLSQGQMQRLSISRALYKNPKLLILDEATSSLDVKNESEISSALQNLKGKLTIIAIAHRLSTLKTCDKLFFMSDGNIQDFGTFAELYARNKDFANLVDLSEINIDKE